MAALVSPLVHLNSIGLAVSSHYGTQGTPFDVPPPSRYTPSTLAGRLEVLFLRYTPRFRSPARGLVVLLVLAFAVTAAAVPLVASTASQDIPPVTTLPGQIVY